MFSKKSFLLIAILALTAVFTLPALAQEGPYLGLEYGEATGLGQSSVSVVVTSIIRVLLGLLGIIAVALIVYAGYLWMTAGGEEEQITKAKSILMSSVIGLAIILSAFAITTFVIGKLSEATGSGGTQSNTRDLEDVVNRGF